MTTVTELSSAGQPDAEDLPSYLASIAHGSPPPVDFLTDLRPHPPGPTSAVLGFTGHHVVAAAVTADWLAAHSDDRDLGFAMRAPFLAALGAEIGSRPGHLDLVLVTRGHRTASVPHTEERLRLTRLPESAHPRLLRAQRYRTDVVAYGTDAGTGLLTLGRGLAGRLEVSFEVDPSARSRGLGRRLASAARDVAEPGELIYAQVSPGNIASVRALLAAGYKPMGSEVLFLDPVGARVEPSDG